MKCYIYVHMVFRADEEMKNGRQRALNKFITRHLPDRSRSEAKLHELIDEYGPVVNDYPYWHPLVTSSVPAEKRIYPITSPNDSSGYRGLDHTIYLRNAFITCPYTNGHSVLDSVEELNDSSVAQIRAEIIDVPLYMPNAVPILVKCRWLVPMESDGTIPKSIAVPMFLEMELPHWRSSKVAETWETMRPYILGSPGGSRSSLFVNQETGQTLKNVWNLLINTGMFGPIYDL